MLNDLDRTDEERVEQIKAWINDYWKTAAIAIVGAVAVIYGLNYYKKSVATEENKYAVMAESVINSENTDDLAGLKQLQGDKPGSSYAALATLEVAKRLYDAKKYDEASAQYQWLIDTAPDVAMQDLARVRNARVLSMNNQAEKAVALLNSIQGDNYQQEVLVLRGDILLADKKYDEAVAAYEKGLDKPELKEYMQQRIDLAKLKKQLASND